jgi:hypothetical protein
MEIRCTNCGGPVQKATVIVQTQTGSGSRLGTGYVNGQSVNTYEAVDIQSDLARNLSSDKPSKPSSWPYSLAVILLVVPLLLACLCSSWFAMGPNGEIAKMLTLVCFVAAIAVGIMVNVVARIRLKNYRSRYNQWWWSVLDRRYFCHSCGTIINV